MSTGLHEVIAAAINQADYPSPVPIHSLFPDISAAAVLASPEMQAIRGALRECAYSFGEEDADLMAVQWLSMNVGLPPAVVNWVLS